MPAQAHAHYLVCTKNKGFQRKHIEVCKRCKSNKDCREYQENLRLEPVTVEPSQPAQNCSAFSRPDFVEKLVEIRKLLGDGSSGHRLHCKRCVSRGQNASLHRYLRTELEAIQSLCQPDMIHPVTHHDYHEKKPVSR